MKVIGTIIKGYVLLLAVALGGFIGAQIGGIVPGIVQHFVRTERALDPDFVGRWVHGGWIIGAGVAGVIAIVRFLRSNTHERELQPASRSRRRREESSSGVLASIGVGGLVGGFLGLALGGTFLLLWFSIAYSPFAPEGWVSSIETKRIRTGSGIERPTATTGHPIALIAFLAPMVLGAAAGGVFGGGAAIFSQWREGGIAPGDNPGNGGMNEP